MSATTVPARRAALRPAAAVRTGLRTGGMVLLEARPKVLAIGGIRYLTGALLSGGVVLSSDTLTGLVAWVLVTTSVYVLNGVTDVGPDRVNGSRRPLASGRLPVRVARAAVAASAVAAVLLSVVVSWGFALHLVVALLLGVRYSSGRRPAKASSAAASVVVVLGGLITYHAGLIAAGGHITVPYLVFSTCLSLWMGVGAVLKDLTDIDGDRAAARATLAVRYGPAPAAGLAWVAAVLITTALVVATTGPHPLAGHLRLPSAAMIAGTVWLGVTCASVALRTRWAYRVFMYTQFAAHGSLVPLY
ncbi:UbiA family prenyltransferase [Cellulomonas sp. NPDC058312]|uniref:UbiA family prenyltransferase n=1 Tax=Cellulomonas sp. NPDC058312 TaxID=3346441 RepID=UPI0036E473AD